MELHKVPRGSRRKGRETLYATDDPQSLSEDVEGLFQAFNKGPKIFAESTI